MKILTGRFAYILSVMMFLLGVAAVAAYAEDMILVQENFESDDYKVGDTSDQWGEKWPNFQAADAMEISNDFAVSGTKSAKITKDGRVDRVFDEVADSKKLTVELYVYPEIDTDRALTMSVLGGDPMNPILAAGGNWGPFIGFLNIGDIGHYDGAQWVSDTTYQANQWYHIKMVTDIDTDTFDFYVNDMDNPVTKDAKFRDAQDSLSGLGFYAGICHIDDILVYEGTKDLQAVQPNGKLTGVWGQIKIGDTSE